MMTNYFIIVDTANRKTDLMKQKWGQFLVSGFGAVSGFWIMWPFEVLKNMAQADYTTAGKTNIERARYIMRTQGVLGFYRGILPGSSSVFLRNGTAMIVMQYANKKIEELGLRD